MSRQIFVLYKISINNLRWRRILLRDIVDNVANNIVVQLVPSVSLSWKKFLEILKTYANLKFSHWFFFMIVTGTNTDEGRYYDNQFCMGLPQQRKFVIGPDPRYSVAKIALFTIRARQVSNFLQWRNRQKKPDFRFFLSSTKSEYIMLIFIIL